MAAGEINLFTYARHLKSGRFGGRAVYHVAPVAQKAGLEATKAAIGDDRQMRNLFTSANPVTAGIKYRYVAKDEVLVKFRPAGMFTIMERQGLGPNPVAAAAAAAAAEWPKAIAKVIKEDY